MALEIPDDVWMGTKECCHSPNAPFIKHSLGSDGYCRDEDGFEYSVDSAYIAIVSVGLLIHDDAYAADFELKGNKAIFRGHSGRVITCLSSNVVFDLLIDGHGHRTIRVTYGDKQIVIRDTDSEDEEDEDAHDVDLANDGKV